MDWVKIDSWHIVWDEKTACGLEPGEGERAETFPEGEKTCEICLRREQKREFVESVKRDA